MLRADMAELADALDLGSSGNTRAGSTPVIRIAKSTGNGISRYFFVNVNGGHIMDYTDVIIIKGPVETLSFFRRDWRRRFIRN